MLFTVAHELTHFSKDWSSVKYRALADALVKQYQKRGVSVSELVGNQIEKAKQNGREMSRQEAFDEVVADSMESMLTDENAAEFLEKLAQRDKGLKEKIVSWLKELAAKLKNALSAYKDAEPDSPEGKMVAEMEDFRKEIMGIYTSALVDAGENFRENGGTLTSDGDYLYSERVTDKDTLDFLNSQETVTTYKTMQIVDGKLYPPMASRIGGKHEDYSVLGEWEQATEHPELIKENGKFKLDKGKGQGSIEAAYNPYMHSSNLVINDQFSGAYARDNLVTVECEVPVSELTSGYRAQYAKDSVGWHAWHTGTVAGAIRKATGVERQVLLSRWIKPVRILSDSEVAAMYKDLLDGTNISVPDNVVTPGLLAELKKQDVSISESGRVKYSDRDKVTTNFETDKYFYRMIDKYDNLKSGSYVTVGKIKKGSPINNVGIPDGNLYFDVSKIIQEMKTRKDPVPKSVMKQIPLVLDHPIVITEYKDKAGNVSINVYGELFIGSSPVVVGVMIGKHRNGLSVDKVQTVHPNRNVLSEVTEENTLYLNENKKETDAWFQALERSCLCWGESSTVSSVLYHILVPVSTAYYPTVTRLRRLRGRRWRRRMGSCGRMFPGSGSC